MEKFLFNISFFILIFLFSIFAAANVGFILNFSVNAIYVLIALGIAFFAIFKKENLKYSFKILACFFGLFFLALIFANLFIDTSFDGRCYHFTIENLFKLGYNPIYNDINYFANKNNIFYNLVFAGSYPNFVELLRSSFYLIFQNMESSKITNFLFIFLGGFYSMYFFLNKTSRLKAAILSFLIFLCPVVICQMNTKMADFIMYYIFLLQLFSLILIKDEKNTKLNTVILVISSIIAVGTKYTGLLNTLIIFLFYLGFKFSFQKLKVFLIFVASCTILCFQPYGTNLLKHKNPFYPSIGHNKLDFMTKQNPREFDKKPYLYKFIRSMFSSVSDSRIENPETPPIFWKIPFTSHFDMPIVSDDMRISGFGHLYSGIFILTILGTIFLFKKKKGAYELGIIYLTTFLNPICWWARFVPWLYLSSIFICFGCRKNNIIFYSLASLIALNGLWTTKENLFGAAYKTYIMNGFYNNLYKKDKVIIYFEKFPYDEEDSTIIPRLQEYGVNFEIAENMDKDFTKIKTEATIAKRYYIKESK